MSRPVHLAGQRLRRRPDKCDAGRRPLAVVRSPSSARRRPLGRRIPRPAASGRTRSLSLVLFPPKPLRWVSAGALLGEVIRLPLCIFSALLHGVVSLPSGRCGCVGTTPRGVYFGRKTAFSEWVLCADGHAVPSCTQCFFGVPAWGRYHYPRRAFHAVETLDARGSRRHIYRFYAVPEFALCGLKIPSAGTHTTPALNRAHNGSRGETRGVFTA